MGSLFKKSGYFLFAGVTCLLLASKSAIGNPSFLNPDRVLDSVKYDEQKVLEDYTNILEYYGRVKKERAKVFDENGEHPLLEPYQTKSKFRTVDATTAKVLYIPEKIGFSKIPEIIAITLLSLETMRETIREVSETIQNDEAGMTKEQIEELKKDQEGQLNPYRILEKYKTGEKAFQYKLMKLVAGPNSELMQALKKFEQEAKDPKVIDKVTNSYIRDLICNKDGDNAKTLIELSVTSPVNCKKTSSFNVFKNKPSPSLLEIKDKDGKTLLMNASMKGLENVVRVLLQKKVDLNEQDNEGNTALILAGKAQHSSIVKLLLENKANVTVRNKKKETYLSIQLSNIKTNQGLQEFQELQEFKESKSENSDKPSHVMDNPSTTENSRAEPSEVFVDDWSEEKEQHRETRSRSSEVYQKDSPRSQTEEKIQ